MTFLATRDGQWIEGADARPWGRPWAFRCDTCGRLLPYGCTIRPNERRTDRDQAREDGRVGVGEFRHRCGDCEGFTQQIGLGL